MSTFKIVACSENDKRVNLTKEFFNERIASIKTRFFISTEVP